LAAVALTNNASAYAIFRELSSIYLIIACNFC